ncbi:putative high affinity copper protein [Xylariaceae sp. FL0804]|nr:putative high affinity copper protein [Xylariaceae sp. FL0804]
MDGMDMDMGSSGCTTAMLWNWNTVDTCFLAESWQISSDGAMAATCIGVLLLVVCLEFLRRLGREYDALILRRFQQHVAAESAAAATQLSKPGGDTCCTETTPLGGEAPLPRRQTTATFRATPLQQLVRAVLHAAAFGLAYVIMLIAMSFNGYVIVCIIVGAGIGKFACDWMARRVVVGGSGGRGAGGRLFDGDVEETTMCCG